MSDGEVVAANAFEVDSQIKSLKKGINIGFLELARYLKQVKDEQLYRDLDYETFESYIAQPELSFDRSTVYRFIQIYEKIVLELHVAPARLTSTDWSKLSEIVPYVNEENKELWLEKAESLSRSDLREETKPLKEEPEAPKEEVIEMAPADAPEVKRFYHTYSDLSYLELQRKAKQHLQFNPENDYFALIMDKSEEGWKLEIQSDTPISKKPVAKCPNVEEGHKGCTQFIDSFAASRGVKFANYPKQIGALHKILRAGYTWEQINEQVDRMEKDKFWSQRGFDISNLANELGKGSV